MSPAYKSRSRSLFTSAVALALGLQIAPWPVSLQAEESVPARLMVAPGKAAHIHTVGRRNQRRNGPASAPQSAQTTELQPSQQGAAAPNTQKSAVQLELERLYQQDGRPVPEMINPGTSQAPSGQQSSAPAGNAGQRRTGQPRLQQPQHAQTQAAQPQTAQIQTAQPQAVQPPQPTPPKKRGLLSKLFSKDNAPSQPPAEPAYVPPQSEVPLTPPAIVGSGAAPAMSPPNYGQVFQQPEVTAAPPAQVPTAPQQMPHVVAQAPVQSAVPQQVVPAPAQPLTATPSGPAASVAPMLITPAPTTENVASVAPAPENDQLDAPLYGETAAQDKGSPLPSIDFNAELQDPEMDVVDLGDAAPLADGETAVAAAEPADPFSDAALFPGSESSSPVTTETSESVTDEEQTVASEEVVAETPDIVEPDIVEEAPAIEENPYSGLTLDSDPFANPEPLRTPAPREIRREELTSANALDQRPALLIPGVESSNEEPPLIVDSSTEENSAPTTRVSAADERTRAKQEMIAARKGLNGLKGFCPVVLREDRDLADAHSQFRAVYNGKTYYMSSSEAVAAFRENPSRYAPASRGCDVIHLAITGEELEGSLDCAVWYKGRLYLFASAETMDSFVAAPSSHATRD